MRLKDKVALITGAGTGIGRACAEAFVREGARVALMGRRREPLQQLARELGSATYVLDGDVSKSADCESVVADTVTHFGALNILVNNAGVLYVGTAESHTEAEFDETYKINVKGLWLMCKASIPHLRSAGGGSIVNLSSVAGLMGIANRVAYGASKGAVTIMTKDMAADLAVDDIRVNCICPGVVETDLVADVINKAPNPELVRKARIALHPLGRFGVSEEIASCAVYLASDESSWVTGAAFPIDGGYTATKT
jgi:NAD(P)-dependent dehydrogenase (short-subunit alcohol dehydrogenase family)